MSNILTKSINKKLSRRTFLKASAAATTLAALGDKLLGGPVSTLVEGVAGAQVEDKWVPSTCTMCRIGCDQVRGYVVNGVLVKIEGNPEFKGKVLSPSLCCVKPRGQVQETYNPYRVKAPMKRTNPNKGINEDPGFVEISWDEALDTLANKLTEIRNSGLRNELGLPRVGKGEHCCTGKGSGAEGWTPFWRVFGTTESSPTFACYGVEHGFTAINQGDYYPSCPDYNYTNWLLAIGKNSVATGYAGEGAGAFKRYTDAKTRGMKTVYLSPYMDVTGAKAQEWIPIKVATDGAFTHAMVYVILHEMVWQDVCDIESLKKMTNSPYLVTPNGYWARDPATKKPLVWDPTANGGLGAAKVEDDPTVGDFALDGGPYTINAVERAKPDYAGGAETPVTQGTPSFQLLIDHFKDRKDGTGEGYTPEWAAAITDVDAETIRRIAREFVENSKPGGEFQTIEIEGVRLPYRPAGIHNGKPVTGGRGVLGHNWAVSLLSMLMGSLHAVGGTNGAFVADRARLDWTEAQRIDGFAPLMWRGDTAPSYGSRFSWPLRSRAISLGGVNSSLLRLSGEDVHGFPASPFDALVTMAANPVVGPMNTTAIRKMLKNVPFFAHFAIIINESTWFADLVMPDNIWITEDWQLIEPVMSNRALEGGSWGERSSDGIMLRQPMVNSPINSRDEFDIMTDLAIRMGPAFHTAFNRDKGIMGPTAEGSPRRYTIEEVLERRIRVSTSVPADVRGTFGLDYLKEHGAFIRPLSGELQRYNYYRLMKRTGTRFDLPYTEGFKRQYVELKEQLHGVGINWLDDQFDELIYGLIPYQNGRAVYEEIYEAGPGSEYDLWVIPHRVHQFGFGRNKDVPWLLDVCDPLSRGIVINPETAEQKELKDGDWVALESKYGRTTGRLIVSPTVRSDTVAVSDYGFYQTPITRERGLPSHGELVAADTREGSAIAGQRPIAIVKIYKTEEIIPNVPIEK